MKINIYYVIEGTIVVLLYLVGIALGSVIITAIIIPVIAWWSKLL